MPALISRLGGAYSRIWRCCWVLLIALVHAATTRVQAAAANDAFAAAGILTGATNAVSASNVGASAEVGEPSHAGLPASASLWWSWTAPDSGPAILETRGSSIDTVLAVYTGDAVDGLTSVVENDDAPGLPTSAVVFNAVQGTTYRIVVDGYFGFTGEVQLGLHLPVAPTGPTIDQTPLGQSVTAGASTVATFTVRANGSHPLLYQWQKNDADILNATNTVLSVNASSAESSGKYRVIIRNAFGTVTSEEASLAVLENAANDAFASRIVLSGESASVSTHNLGATLEAGEPRHASVDTAASLWWTWTAARDGLVQLDTLGSTNLTGKTLDTVLSVYSGNSVATLENMASNDDEIPGILLSSKAVFRAAAGQTYHIAVAGRAGRSADTERGGIALNLQQMPDNDQFENALVFPVDSNQVLDNNTGATEQLGEPDHAGNPGGKSVWWQWTAPVSGVFALDTVGSAIDTMIAVYTGGQLSALQVVGEDDNRSDDGASLVKFLATAGTTYRIVVDGYADDQGTESGAIVLNLNPALSLNDAFNERLTLSGLTNVVTASNVGAGKELGEPNHAGNPGGRSLWWTWTAHQPGRVVVSTGGSNIDTSLAVYTGGSLADLKVVAENDDGDPFNPDAGSLLSFDAVPGETYQIAVDGYRFEDGFVAEGTVVLRLAQVGALVVGGNDAFENRYALEGQTNTVAGINLAATREAGEPTHAGNDGGRSLWWTWKATRTSPVRLDTIGSQIDTVLAVYTGTNVASLEVIQEDEDSAGDGKSLLVFEAIEGVEYQIAVDGFNDGDGAEAGRIVLSLHQFSVGALHANDDLENASPINEPFLTVVGSNIGASRQSGEPSHGAMSTGHSVWWTWRAEADEAVTISTTDSQFDTLLSVYTGNQLDSLSLVAENDDAQTGVVHSQVTFQAQAGVDYRIAVDGYAREIGFIKLSVQPRLDLGPAPVIQRSPVNQTRYANGAGGGSDVVFRVVATGALPMGFQWYRGNEPLTGQTNETLRIDGATTADSGLYRVVVNNAFGAATSDFAALSILAAPFNDTFQNRTTVAGVSNVVHGSILGATKEAGEQDHGGEAGGQSVWWRWTAPATGRFEIHTLGSSFDTVLGVYTGDSLYSLVRIAGNDDIVTEQISASRVVIDAVAGQEYQIAVDAVKTNTPEGDVMLTIRPPALPAIQLLPLEGLPNGGVRLRFSATEAGVSLDPAQFEVQFTSVLDAGEGSWKRLPGEPVPSNGDLIVDDRDALEEPTRFYRVSRRLTPP